MELWYAPASYWKKMDESFSSARGAGERGDGGREGEVGDVAAAHAGDPGAAPQARARGEQRALEKLDAARRGVVLESYSVKRSVIWDPIYR